MPTSIFYIFLIYGAANAIVSGDCPNDKSNLAPIRLRKDLLCGYEKNERPVLSHKDAIPVVMRMILKYFDYNIHDNSFTVHNWMALYWKDVHLKWDPNNYESIKSIHLADSEIWVPDISVYNRRNQGGSPDAIDSASCVISNEGQVVCVPPTEQSSLCVSDLSKFPFDTHNCTIRFGSWVHSGEEIDIKLAKPAISTEDLVPNGEWVLEDTQVVKHPGKFKCCPNSTYPSVNFSFIIKRLTGAHTASVILPALALVLITLTSLWIEPQKSHRLSLCYLNLICEFLYIQYVSWVIPMNGDKIPLLLLFARDSLLLSAFTIIFTIALKKIVEDPNPAPGWMSAIVSFLIACKPGQIILLGNASAKELASAQKEDDGKSIIEDQKEQPKDRFLYCVILDRVCFFIFFIIYVVMFVGFTP